MHVTNRYTLLRCANTETPADFVYPAAAIKGCPRLKCLTPTTYPRPSTNCIAPGCKPSPFSVDDG